MLRRSLSASVDMGPSNIGHLDTEDSDTSQHSEAEYKDTPSTLNIEYSLPSPAMAAVSSGDSLVPRHYFEVTGSVER